MEATKALKTQGVKHTEWRRFTTLVKMLLSDSLKISFDTKNSRKSAIIRIVTGVLLFAAITAFGVVLYRLAITLGIFSLLAFVPEVVPSALSIFIILLAVFNATNGLVKNLYFSNDNRLMITYPCRGSTIFLARLFVYYVNELVRMFIVLSPILLSYVIVSKFPWYSFVWLFIAILIVTAAVVLIGALFSIPWYYVRSFLKRNSLIALFVYAIVFAGFIWLVTWVISLIPDKIDIFTNFGPYFAKIQTLMKGYRHYCWYFLDVTKMMIGNFDGFSLHLLDGEASITLAIFLGIIALLMVFSFFVVNKLYLHLASESFEYDSVGSLTSRFVHARPFFLAQFDKERVLLEKSPDAISALFGVFVFLPIAMALINKVFGAMDTNYRGNEYISAVNLLLVLLVALVSNETIAHLYSDEGAAFALNRSFPKKPMNLLFAKLITPIVLGVVSLIITSCNYWSINQSKLNLQGEPWVSPRMAVYFAIAVCAFYIGHMLFAASSDFCNLNSTFAAQNGATKAQRNVVITAFIIAISQAYLFYLYMDKGDGMESAYLKIMIVGLVFLTLNVILFIRKTKYIFGRGE